MAKASKATVQVKRKRWVPIIAPKLFNEMQLGESYLLEPKDAVGRTVRVSVMQLTGEPQKQYISAAFTITDVQGDKLRTEIKSYKILASALRRLVRRNKDKFEDSFLVTSADGRSMRVKPFVVTRFRSNGGILTALRKVVRIKFTEIAAATKSEQFYADVITGKVQQGVQDALKKTYPVGACEVRWLELLGAAPVSTEAPTVEPAKEEPAEPEVPAETETTVEA
ncbi:MAG: hypothetical protein AABY13_02030 [Nanoarchaeota archaeon]